MSKKILVLKNEIWGPMTWHMIHNFSIKSKNNNCMLILIKTLGYILPCPTCKKHYNYLINDIYKLDEKDSNKNNMIKYLYDVHNIINDNLDKNIKISYNKSIELNKKTNNSKFIFLIVSIYTNINYNNISFNEFDKIYNFLICFLNNYPSKKLNEKFKILLKSEKFKNIDTPLELKKWFINDFKKLDYIDDLYKKHNKKIIRNL